MVARGVNNIRARTREVKVSMAKRREREEGDNGRFGRDPHLTNFSGMGAAFQLVPCLSHLVYFV